MDTNTVEGILALINKNGNRQSNAALVRQLETLNCTRNLKDIFAILFYQGYEAKMSAAKILEEQSFEFSKQDLEAISAMWEDCKKHPEKCPDFKKCEEEMQDYVEGFMSYMDEV